MRDGTKGMLAVCVGAGCLALAVGVWLIPSSIFRPADRAETAQPTPRTPTGDERTPDQVDDTRNETPSRIEEWDALAARMDRFLPRRPVEEIPPDEPTGPGDTIDIPARWSPSWIYEGYVASRSRPAALVRIAGMQQFIFVGDEITDPGIGGSAKVRVESIEPERIRVSMRGEDGVVERAEPQQPATGVRPTPVRPTQPRPVTNPRTPNRGTT